ncbi:STAS domain-containing protein [Streptomyces sp. SID13666]|uniref:STAS domain-containing protein n=1 Tax=Streptomyces TaxID=1883 RepID=UPI0011057A4D|nr:MULTISPECIES: STAS domain-containing protein [Streptomyces]MCZ4096728.1 STAS domain-containing protein [Streptomyces sp. H39-C1]NEA56108.1 STAS domain-containing protein [Streptomyces sp. SID13666]NEA71779.1 STAS domain-containing protein [Streptomyces sp. SID13588]QNA77170.1 STAS domain-containing protein [Streptomyces sp. So13.3]
MTDLHLTTQRTPAGSVLAVAGDLDHDSAGRFRGAVALIALQPGQLLTVDFGGLTFCDSSGITALIAARNQVHEQGADIVLTEVPAVTVRILRLLGLDQIFRIQPVPGADTDPVG